MVLDFKNDPEIKQLIATALNEDIREGDHSSLSCIPPSLTNRAKLIAKDKGIIAGVALARVIAAIADPGLRFEILKNDGDTVAYGDIVLRIEGPTQSLLKAERLILNFMQRLSGIATTTHNYVNAVKGTNCKILDTRKTTPGLRRLEKWAVLTGGGHNHRVGLFDMIMLKDNHIDAAGGIQKAIRLAHEYRLRVDPTLKIEIETRNIREVQEAIDAASADRIMLDNFTAEQVKEAVALIAGRFETEASGGITLETVKAYAETGVDYISVGALTHSVLALDLSLKIEK